LPTLSEIWIYPIKSLGGVRLAQAHALPKGLAWDRRWMLISEDGQFLTQRTLPQLALFRVEMDEQMIYVRFENQQLAIGKALCDGPGMQASIWNDRVQVVPVAQHADQWFSERLSLAVRLVQFPDDNPRPVDPAFSPEGSQVSLADGYPYLIIGEESLRDLNHRLQTPVPMNRFRPNFVFSGGTLYEEDQWNEFQIGEVPFAGVKPCARCVMITTDQQTAQRGTEPLATLAGYRKQQGKVYFGQNGLALKNGPVRVGDEIIIKKQKHRMPEL